MSEIDDAVSAISRGEQVTVSDALPNASSTEAKVKDHLDGTENIIVAVIPATTGTDPADALSAMLSAAPGDHAVVVLINGTHIAAADKGYQFSASDMMDRASSINNDPIDAVGTFATLVHKGQASESIPVSEPAPQPPTEVPLGTGVMVAFAVAVAAAGGVAFVKRAKKKPIPPDPERLRSVPVQRLSARDWSLLISDSNLHRPRNLDASQRQSWEGIIEDLSETVGNWDAAKRAGIAEELHTIATVYLTVGGDKYGRLPDDMLAEKNAQGITPRQAMSRQLESLHLRTEVLRRACYGEDLAALSEQSNLLDVKYGESLDFMGLNR